MGVCVARFPRLCPIRYQDRGAWDARAFPNELTMGSVGHPSVAWVGYVSRLAVSQHGFSTAQTVLELSEGEHEMNMADVKKMTKVERLQAMEALWDSLLYEDGEVDPPKWHEEILKERKNKITSGEARFVSLAELKTSRKP